MSENSISVKMDPDLKRQVRVAAAASDESMSVWVRRALIEKLEREGEIEEGNSTPTTTVPMATTN